MARLALEKYPVSYGESMNTVICQELPGKGSAGGYSNEDDFFIPVLSPGKELTSFIQTNKSLIHLRASYCNMGMNAINELALVLQKDQRSQ